MPLLADSEHVMARAGVRELAGYTDLIPITDAPGFAVRRAYPGDAEIAHVLDRQGGVLVKAIIQLIVERPTALGGTSPVTLRAWVFPRWKSRRLFAGPHELPPGDPDAPTSDSLQRWRLARKPRDVDSVGDFTYDAGEDRFRDTDGREVTPAAMLDHIYQAHLRTLRARFVWRWNAGSFVRWIARRTVWTGQDVFMWTLLKFYDVERAPRREQLAPFHVYRWSDFVRSAEAEGERSTFFGFQSSRKNLFTNLVVLAGAVAASYHFLPRDGLLRAIYKSDALTTAVLLLGFFAADVIGPAILKTLICGLSRLRGPVLFLARQVKP